MNELITAPKVHVISEEGEQLGEMVTSEALERAQSVSMDLVQVWMRDWVPMTKIQDYGKEQFKKKKNQQKWKAHKIDLKTLRISYKISEHDLDVRRKQAEKFAKVGHNLRVELLLRGREKRFVNEAKQKLTEFSESLSDIYTTDGSIGQQWFKFSMQFKPNKKK